jgi:hypothetical protein
MEQGANKPPSLEKLEWVKTFLELILLLLAIPWVLIRLLKDPVRGLRDLGESYFG